MRQTVIPTDDDHIRMMSTKYSFEYVVMMSNISPNFRIKEQLVEHYCHYWVFAEDPKRSCPYCRLPGSAKFQGQC